METQPICPVMDLELWPIVAWNFSKLSHLFPSVRAEPQTKLGQWRCVEMNAGAKFPHLKGLFCQLDDNGRVVQGMTGQSICVGSA